MNDSDMMLRADAIACIRGGRELLADLSFSLAEGESLLLRGPNGVGKSSLLRLIAGLLTCHRGALVAQGKLALADEHLALDAALPLGQALAFWAHMDGLDETRLSAEMERFELAPLAEIPVRMLSTGQRKRAILARVFASGAPLLLLDEPGNGLDGASLCALGAAMDAHLDGGGAIVAASHFDLPHRFTRTLDLAERAE